MRIMDCVLLLFRRTISPVIYDAERECVTPSWGESLKVTMATPLANSNRAITVDLKWWPWGVARRHLKIKVPRIEVFVFTNTKQGWGRGLLFQTLEKLSVVVWRGLTQEFSKRHGGHKCSNPFNRTVHWKIDMPVTWPNLTVDGFWGRENVEVLPV